MMRIVAAVLLLPLVLSAAGCRSLAFILPEPTKTIVAEYPYLAGKRSAIVVHADMETQCLYPHVQYEVADHVRIPLEANVRGITVVETRKIVDFQRNNANWDAMDPAALGKKFGAERLLEIDLTQYTTREPESEFLYRGHITAALRIYNTEYPNSQPAYKAQVQTTFPPGGPGQYGTSDHEIRRATMEAFAQDVAAKFYDRTVSAK